MTKSITTIKMLKFGFNLIDDGLVCQQIYAGETTMIAYGTNETVKSRNTFFRKKRKKL